LYDIYQTHDPPSDPQHWSLPILPPSIPTAPVLQGDLAALLREQLELEDAELAALMEALTQLGVKKAEARVLRGKGPRVTQRSERREGSRLTRPRPEPRSVVAL
jgi:hypothetical protein